MFWKLTSYEHTCDNNAGHDSGGGAAYMGSSPSGSCERRLAHRIMLGNDLTPEPAGMPERAAKFCII